MLQRELTAQRHRLKRFHHTVKLFESKNVAKSDFESTQCTFRCHISNL